MQLRKAYQNEPNVLYARKKIQNGEFWPTVPS